MGKRFDLRGGNAEALAYRESGELVLSGPAGTGKTLASLLRLLDFGLRYRGARMLIVRKTRVSLTESALVTWERDILGEGSAIIGKPINRANRHQYKFPNGSVLVTGGMDRPDKILSTEYDLIYVPEATDLTLLDWETLSGRLRAGAGPYDLLFGDCNPTTPTHWIYRRAQQRKLKLVPTTHRDNPRFWDEDRGRWTPAGERYIARLRQMTGARRKRFLEGIWAAAEGLVYDGFDPLVHLHPAGWRPPSFWPRVWGLDFGFSNPMSLLMFALDGDGRLHLYREFYRTGTRVELLAKWARAEIDERGEVPPDAVLTDHDPENVATFEQYSGLACTPADKQKRDEGIEAVQSRFDIQADGRPRLYGTSGSLAHPPDQELLDTGKPACWEEELLGYVMDTRNPDRLKDEPLKVNDHAMDATRYVVRYCDAVYGNGSGNLDRYGSPDPEPADHGGAFSAAGPDPVRW